MTTTAIRGPAPKEPGPNQPGTGLPAREPARPGPSPATEPDVLVQGRHHDPHSLLGRHDGLVRALRPGAGEMYLLVTGAPPDGDVLARVPMHQVHPGGLWEAPLDPAAAGYRLEAVYGARARRASSSTTPTATGPRSATSTSTCSTRGVIGAYGKSSGRTPALTRE